MSNSLARAIELFVPRFGPVASIVRSTWPALNNSGVPYHLDPYM